MDEDLFGAPIGDEDEGAAASMATALAGRGNEEARARKKDAEFYPTPEEVTRALILAEPWLQTPRRIWEPHCGEGAICDVLAAAGHEVWGSDLRLRVSEPSGWLHWPHEQDFAAVPHDCPPDKAQAIIMNPPFSLARDHIRHALGFMKYGVQFVASLLPAGFWHSDKRTGHLALFRDHPPASVYPCAWRPDFTGEGGNMFNLQWCVWIIDYPRPTVFRPLEKPGAPGAQLPFDQGGEA